MTHELMIDPRGAPSNFEITVDGTINTTVENPIEEAIIASGSTVEGLVDDAILEFFFSGDVTDITVTGAETAVFIDGEAVDPAEYHT